MSKAKPIYEVYLPQYYALNSIVQIKERLESQLNDSYNVIVIHSQDSTLKTRIIYPKPSFWGLIHNLMENRRTKLLEKSLKQSFDNEGIKVDGKDSRLTKAKDYPWRD